MNNNKKKSTIIYTIGHSTHSLPQFIALLQQYKITHLIDIRTIPRSRHNPQFNEKHFSNALTKNHILYTHLPELGGLRHTTKDSINKAWHNASFRGFADYMQTAQFAQAIQTLIGYAHHKQVVIMCAEAVPWRCHRSLIGDALTVQGYNVEDIFSATSVKPHKLIPWAHVWGAKITYPETVATKTIVKKKSNSKSQGDTMPYKVGKKTKTKGYPILKNENGKWKVIAHSSTVAKAQASIRARHIGAHNKK